MALPDLRLRQGTHKHHRHHASVHVHDDDKANHKTLASGSSSGLVPTGAGNLDGFGLGIRKRSWSAEYSSEEEDDRHAGERVLAISPKSRSRADSHIGKKVQLLTQPVNMSPLSPPNICYPSSTDESDDEEDEQEERDGEFTSRIIHKPRGLPVRPPLSKRRKSVSNAILSRRNSVRRNSLRRRLSAPWVFEDGPVSSGSIEVPAAPPLVNRQTSPISAANLGISLGYQSGCSGSRKRRTVTVSEQDRIARQRCFDYLVSAIDQVWAQYCESTSCAESQLYDHDEEEGDYEADKAGYQKRRAASSTGHTRSHSLSMYTPGELPCSPVSLDDECYEGSNVSCNNSEQEEQGSSRKRQGSVLQQPKSMSLMNIKKRLLNAKYFFDHLLDSLSPEDSADFWHRWDLIKYTAIELVEETDDDDIIETASAELERGRTCGRN